MNNSLGHQLKELIPVWVWCVFLPLPAILFWRSDDGRAMTLLSFSIGCASLVAYAFRHDLGHRMTDAAESPAKIWRQRMRTVTVALFLAFVGFSLESLSLSDEQGFVAVFLAFLVLIPSICVVPFLTLATRRPVAAVVFALFIVFCMKLVGCIVVVIVHGWNASQHGHTNMPWTHPNLLVWLFWFNTGVLSLLLYHLGARRFQARFSTP